MPAYYDCKCTVCGRIERRYRNVKRCRKCHGLVEFMKPPTIDELQSIIATQADQIRRLKEDAERLAKVVKVRGDSTICYCGYPDFNDEHVPNCPIILHAALMKELE